MGEIADCMIAGICCSLCGQYFNFPDSYIIKEHGYPVVCWDCWDDSNISFDIGTGAEFVIETSYQKSLVKTL